MSFDPPPCRFCGESFAEHDFDGTCPIPEANTARLEWERDPQLTLIDVPATPAGALGSRGGETEHVAEGVARLESGRGEELAEVRGRIIEHAAAHELVHADDVHDVELSERNVIGAAFRGLVEDGLLEQTKEHRASRVKAAHGRRSYVYRITDTGREMGHYLIDPRRADAA